MARACVFDVNETLLDTGALDAHLERVFGDASARSAWFGRFLELWLTDMVTGSYQEFGTVAGLALGMLAEERGVELSDDDRQGIIGDTAKLPPHPEVEEGLSRLRDAGLRLATLTNSTAQVGEAQIENSGLGDYFEQALSAAAFVARPGKALFPTAPPPDGVGADLREVADRVVAAEEG